MAVEGDELFQSNRMVGSRPKIAQPLARTSNTLPDVYSPASLAGKWGEWRSMTPPRPSQLPALCLHRKVLHTAVLPAGGVADVVTGPFSLSL